MNGNHPTNVPIEPIFSFTPQTGLHHPRLSPTKTVGSYTIDDALYRERLLRDLYTIQQAHPELTPQQCQYILRTKIRTRMQELSKQPNMRSPTSQNPGGLLNVLPQETEATLSSVPLSRTESCPLPYQAIEKSPMMRRQLSSVIPSSIPGPHLGFSANVQNHAGMAVPYNFPGAYMTSTSAPALYGIVSAPFLPTAQPIAAPSTAISVIPTPVSIAGYLRQNSRDDPFSSVRGNACAKTIEQAVNGEINHSEVFFNPSTDVQLHESLLSQFSPHQLTSQNVPYTIDFNNPAFTAPRMEPQLSTSTFFDSASTTLELECVEDHASGFSVKATMGEEPHFDFAAISMSPNQPTFHENQTGSVIPLSVQEITGNKELLPIATFNQSFSPDLHLLPELTHTVETPSSPAQMSRQHSAATNHTNNFGVIPRSSGNIDSLTAPEMDRQWSDLSNPVIAHPCQDNIGTTGDGQTRKRVRQPPPEDMNLLLRGAGIIGTDVLDYYANSAAIKAHSNIDGGLGTWTSVSLQVSASAQDLDELVLESNLRDANPIKLRKLDGQDVSVARAHASQTRMAVQDFNSTPTGFQKFVQGPTTHPLPTFDQHLQAMRRSETGPLLSTGTQPSASDAQQVITTTTTTVKSVLEVNKNPATNGVAGSRQRSNGSININSGNSLTAARTYVRRAQPRVFCDLCQEVPDGFRGDHELRRHKDRVHATKKKVWVTKDISPTGDFLSGCKACKRGKHYYADYNAAAHLRRQHFCREGKRGKSKKERDDKKRLNIEKVKSKLEKWGIDLGEDPTEATRGGANRVGEEFTLKFLRRWMQPIEISSSELYTKSHNIVPLSDEEEDGSDENDETKRRNLHPGTDLNTNPTKESMCSGDGKVGDIAPPPYSLIDIAPAVGPSPSFLETQRELEEMLAPVMDKVDMGIDSFYALQNGLG